MVRSGPDWIIKIITSAEDHIASIKHAIVIQLLNLPFNFRGRKRRDKVLKQTRLMQEIN